MQTSTLRSTLKKLTKSIRAIVDKEATRIINVLLNLVENLNEDNKNLRDTVQELNDSLNVLKGEQKKPVIRKQTQKNTDHSSEEERKKPKPNKRKPKKKKKGKIPIDRKETCHVDKTQLPDDIQFKGWQSVVIQDIKIVTDNVEFKKAIYYSPSLKKTFIARLPSGYHGQFGPGIRSWILTLYNDSGMTEPALARFFKTVGIQISKATISRLLTDNYEAFHQEKSDIVKAGLQSTRYQHFDDTSARVDGKNYHTHILCNPYYTAYFTRPKKDRLTVLEILSQGELKFSLTEVSYHLMSDLGVSGKSLTALTAVNLPEIMTRNELDDGLKNVFPDPDTHKTSRRIILEASAIVYYQSLDHAIPYLMCDDAPQFNKIALYKILCWIHGGRHYKKINPITPIHIAVLEKFIDTFWCFYRKLKTYKENPTEAFAIALDEEFDELFSTKTGYDALDDRLEKTMAKKASLLLVLQCPFLPLHNNPAELGARVQARKRDIHLQTKNDKGTQAKDTLTTIVQTAKKLHVNIQHYLYDRITGTCEMSSLASLIPLCTEPIINST